MFRHDKWARVMQVAVSLAVGGAMLAGCTSTPTASPTASPGAIEPVSGSSPQEPAVSVRSENKCSAFPTPECTGVPAGVRLTTQEGDMIVTTAGEVVDSVHVTGALLIKASNVTVRNSQIDGDVNNQFDDEPWYSFTITDSTIGADSSCDSTGSALGEGSFTAERVRIQGFGDGIRASAPDITIKDSYIKLCSTQEDSHSDGIQDYPRTGNLIFDHNTVDQCGPVPADGECKFRGGFTAPVFINSTTGGGTRGARITNNLLMGGVHSIYLHPQPGAPWIVTGNRIVDGTWSYAPAETGGLCREIEKWSDNAIVKIDANYRVTAVQQSLPCPT